MLIKKETLWALVKATGKEISEVEQDDIIFHAYDRAGAITPKELVDVEIMSDFLNIPLQIHIESIKKHYIHMSATKQWICIKYPSTVLRAGKKNITIPEPMQSLLSQQDKQFIWSEWERLFPNKFKIEP